MDQIKRIVIINPKQIQVSVENVYMNTCINKPKGPVLLEALK